MEFISDYLNPLNWAGFWDAFIGAVLLIYCGFVALMPPLIVSLYKRVGFIMELMEKSELPE